MKRLLLAATLLAFTAPAFAADPPKAVPSDPATVPVAASLLDLQVSIIAIQHAGEACDAGIKVYCQIVPAREGTLAKLAAAAQSIQQPTTPGK